MANYIWTGFSIPEWGENKYLTIEEIAGVKTILNSRKLGSDWHRIHDKSITWELSGGVDEELRLELHEAIWNYLVPGRKELLLRWVGVRATLTPVFTMNEHIQ